MDCHRCAFLRYDGSPYGHCTHSGHKDVVFSVEDRKKRVKDGVRPYDRRICPDFLVKRRCSNCKYWIRGRYFADGRTPASKGRCSLRCDEIGGGCPMWRSGASIAGKKSCSACPSVQDIV